MAGLTKDTPIPTEIKLHKTSRLMELAFDNGSNFQLSFEFLRVHSPSAEVRGHGPGQEVLQLGKKDVEIVDVQPVGQYAVKLVFSDGHDSGIYSWDLLYSMGQHRDAMWQDYLSRVKSNCAGRTAAAQGGMCGGLDTDEKSQGGGGCGGHGHGGGCGHHH